MRGFVYKIFRNLADAFRGWNLFFHALAILLTWLIVQSGLDWSYFQFFRHTALYRILFSAAILGGLLPILLPLILLVIGRLRRSSEALRAAFALGQAAILGSIVSSFYKAFTGRVPPEMFRVAPAHDISRVFQFGFLRGGIFWGWPSSHATIAFAMALALIMLYPRNRAVRWSAVFYALYIALGVSMSIHWLSDAIAGIIIGAVIGRAVGRSFRDFTAESKSYTPSAR